MALIKCSECGKEVSTAAASCPNCGFAPKASSSPPAKRRGRLRWYIGGAVLFFVVVGIIGGQADKSGSAPASQPAARAAAAPPVDQMAQMMPATERDFIAAVNRGMAAYRSGETEFQKGASRPARAHEICQVLRSPAVGGWVGKLDEISTNGDGNGVISIEIAPDVHIKTWNNSLSDVMDRTLVAAGTPLFQSLFALRPHQTVAFSGTFLPSQTDCVQEPSLTMSGSMTDPGFIFRFATVAPPIQPASTAAPAAAAPAQQSAALVPQPAPAQSAPATPSPAPAAVVPPPTQAAAPPAENAAATPAPSPVQIATQRGQTVGSLNGGFVYYLAEKSATSDEIVQRKLSDGSVKEIVDGNGVAVIRNGAFAGYLLADRHTYRQGGAGSYECLFVVRPDGKETFPVTDPRGADQGVRALVAIWPDEDAKTCGVG